jgi:two-component system chemotaxis response regulator CheB
VILTGNLDDGTAGLWAIKQLGGTTIVQHPDDALFPSMPASALSHVAVDHVVPLHGVAPLLVELTVREPGAPRLDVPDTLEIEVKIAKEEDPIQAGTLRLGVPSRFTCPECHGVLLEMREAGRLRFRCHTGHAYSLDSLIADVREQIEVQLWTTIRTMQEGGLLMRTVAQHVNEEHPSADVVSLQRHADDLQEQANRLREMVTSGTAPNLRVER